MANAGRHRVIEAVLAAARLVVVAVLLVGLARRATAGVDVWTLGDQPGGAVAAAAVAGDLCYAGVEGGGLFRSTDGCQHWSRISAFAGGAVSSLAIDVTQPSTAYAGTSAGVWRTLDGGGTWAQITGAQLDGAVDAVVVDPTTAGHAWFVGGGQVFRTTTSGDGIWQDVTANATAVRSVVFDPTTGWLWAWAGGPYVAVQMTPGGTWSEGETGLGPAANVVGIAVDRGAERLLFADELGLATLPSTSGPTWNPLADGLPNTVYPLGLATDRAGNAYLTAIGGSVYRLLTGSSLWARGDGGLLAGARAVWADAGAAGTVLAGTASDDPGSVLGQGPLWRSNDAATTWVRSADGIDAVGVVAVAADPLHRGHVLAATRNDGVQRSDDGGTTWTGSTGIRSAGAAVVFDPTRDGVAFAGLNGGSAGVLRSVDGGSTWSGPAAGTEGTGVSLIAVDARGRAFAVANNDVVTSSDGGVTWAPVPSAGLPMFIGRTALATDPGAPGDVWLGTLAGPYRLRAGAASWEALTTDIGAVDVAGFGFDPHQPGRVYAAVSTAGVWRSDDDGAHWVRASNGIPDLLPGQVVGDARTAGVAYAVSPSGVFRTTDAGGTWSALPSSPAGIGRIAIDLNGNTLYGATDGAGVVALSQGAAPTMFAPPTITGTLRPRSTLHGDPGGWDAAPAPDFAFQWLRCNRHGARCHKIRKAMKADYRAARADLGRRLELAVTATNAHGTVTASSVPTAVVRRKG